MDQPGSARRSSPLVLGGVLIAIAATTIAMAALTVLAVRWLVGLW